MWQSVRRYGLCLILLATVAGCDARGQQTQTTQGNARVDEVRLTDGTRCVTYASTIDCDWTSKGWTSTGAQP